MQLFNNLSKRIILVFVGASIALSMQAKDIHTLVMKTVKPQMHCSGCENKIKSNVRYAKGVKSIDTDLQQQTVTIKYDADKGKKEDILKIMDKIGFSVEILSDKKEAVTPAKKK